MNKKNIIIISGILLLLFALGTFGVLFMTNKFMFQGGSSVVAPTETPPTPTPQPVVKLQFNLTAQTVSVGETADVFLILDTLNESVSNVDLYMAFDPKTIEIVSVGTGGFFDSQLDFKNTIDNDNGSLYYAFGSTVVKKGSGNLVLLTVRGKAIGSSQLTILPNTLVMAQNSSISHFEQTVPCTITVQ